MQHLTEVAQQRVSTVRIGFLLSEGFDFYALAAALEPLRLANEVARCAVCQWQILSLSGWSLKASNGIATATVELSQAKPLDVLIVCRGDEMGSGTGALQPRHRVSRPTMRRSVGQVTWLLPPLPIRQTCLPVTSGMCIRRVAFRNRSSRPWR